MNKKNRLHAAMDAIVGPKNMIASEIEEVNRFYDPRTSQHILTFQYKVKVAAGEPENRRTRGQLGSNLFR